MKSRASRRDARRRDKRRLAKIAKRKSCGIACQPVFRTPRNGKSRSATRLRISVACRGPLSVLERVSPFGTCTDRHDSFATWKVALRIRAASRCVSKHRLSGCATGLAVAHFVSFGSAGSFGSFGTSAGGATGGCGGSSSSSAAVGFIRSAVSRMVGSPGLSFAARFVRVSVEI